MSTTREPDQALREARASSFGVGADLYDRTRPAYPDDAVAWVLPRPSDGAAAPRVLDLAAGTGKLTAGLVAAGADVVAVEPSDGMRATLRRALPDVPALGGSAERIPLDGASLDGVVVAQAWHWFDQAAACAEVARVLRGGGRLGVLWNVRSHTVDWVRRFTEIIHRGDTLGSSHGPPVLTGPFGPLEHATFPWTQHLRTSALRDLAGTRSHVLTLPPADREALLGEVDALAREHPDLRGREHVDMPYVTVCWRADRA